MPHLPDASQVAATPRLTLRRLTTGDAPFILRLLNEPSWLQFIGDKNVRTLDDARQYLLKGPLDMYARHGFGLYLVELQPDRVPVGMCGLIRRDVLADVDIGFAFLPEFWGRGLGRESAAAVLEHARRDIGLQRVVAVTSVDNARSIQLLESLGFRFESMVRLAPGEPEIKMFGWQAPPREVRDLDYAARVRRSFESQRFMALLGAELLEVQPGRVEIALNGRQDLTQQQGALHAGVTTAIADSACGYAALTLMAPGAEVLSVEYKVNLLAPAVAGRFVAVGRAVRSGRTLTVCTGEVRALAAGGETVVLLMQATMIAVQPRPEGAG